MRKYALILLIFLITISGYGQDKFDLDWGLKVGLNNSKITTDRDQFTSENILSYHVGAFARVNLGRIYLQPEGYFISKGGDIKEILSYNPLQTISSFNYNAFDFPVLVGVNIVDKEAFNVRTMVGPLFSIATKRDIESKEETPTFSKQYFKDNFLGWQFGIGADFLFLTFDARIERSFGNVYNDPTVLKSKSNTLLLSLGIKL